MIEIKEGHVPNKGAIVVGSGRGLSEGMLICHWYIELSCFSFVFLRQDFYV